MRNKKSFSFMNRFMSLMAGALFLGASAAFAVPPVSAPPADLNTTGFSGFGVSNATPLSYFISSAAPAGVARFHSVAAYSDKASAVLQFYYTTNSSAATNGSTVAAGTNTIWGNGFTNFAANDILVIRYSSSNSTDFYERNKVSGTPTSSNCVLTWVTQYPLNYGDTVYQMKTGAKVPMFTLTNALVSVAGAGVAYGQEGKPTLLELDATTSGSIFGVSGEYWRRPRP
jgi:hypothetical protein